MLPSCGEEQGISPYKNTPPTVWLDGGPPEGTVSVYKIEFSWGGQDPDGSIDHFEYCITNNDGAFDPADTTGADKWTQTTATIDTFNFSADIPVDTLLDDPVEEFRRSHTFFIRSVDDRGMASREAAYRSFTAMTLSPEVTVLIPRYVRENPALVPPISTFQWVADDYVGDRTTRQDPDWVSWILEPTANHNYSFTETIEYIRGLPIDSDQWGDWVWYPAADGSGTSWTTPPQNTENYIFAIRAKDEAGAITPVFSEYNNVRRVRVGTGGSPILTVYNSYLGALKTATCSTPITITDFPAGVAIQFTITADASNYGGEETGYRYGWDVANPDNPDDWEMEWTSFPPHPYYEPPSARTAPFTFFGGTRTFRAEVIDNSGFKSCLEVKVNVVTLSMERNLLLIDDFKEPSNSGWTDPEGKGVFPNDAEHDQFWNLMLQDVEGFDNVVDVWEVNGGSVISLAQLGNYKSIIWSVYGHAEATSEFPLLHDVIKFRPKDEPMALGSKLNPSPLALYLAAGGHVLIAGQHPVSMSINKTYTPRQIRFPVIFAYELDLRQYSQEQRPDPRSPSGDDSFPYRELCLETMEYAFVDATRWRDPRLTCSNSSDRSLDNSLRDHTMRAALPLDLSFPRLELRPEAAGLGKYYAPDQQGLDAEVYNPVYFADLCPYVPRYRSGHCFEPIFGLECIDLFEPVFNQPVAFWTTVFADKIAEAPGSIPARSAVFGFPPVMFSPGQSKTAIEYILFDEWRLPRTL